MNKKYLFKIEGLRWEKMRECIECIGGIKTNFINKNEQKCMKRIMSRLMQLINVFRHFTHV